MEKLGYFIIEGDKLQHLIILLLKKHIVYNLGSMMIDIVIICKKNCGIKKYTKKCYLMRQNSRILSFYVICLHPVLYITALMIM